MDPIAHTFTGAALAAAGLRRKTPLATAALLIGANAPDIDALSYFGPPFGSLAFRRGWTHGMLALAVLPVAVTALLLLWDRLVRLRRDAGAAPARARPLLFVSALAVLTHPTLDWLNNYGMRWLMPFDGRWFYGDAVFIVDPWLWVGLGGIAFLMYSRRAGSLVAWTAFWLVTSAIVLLTPGLPVAARVLWFAAVATWAGLRTFGVAAQDREARIERGARVMLACALAYVGMMIVLDFAEQRAACAELAARSIGRVERIMIAPVPANPFVGDVVAATPTEYYVGTWNWLAKPRLTLTDAPIEKQSSTPIYAAAARTPEARRFLKWARFPYIEVESTSAGHVVRFFDARYRAAGPLYGPTITLDGALEPVASARAPATGP